MPGADPENVTGWVDSLLHNTWLSIGLMSNPRFTVTSTVNGIPMHPPADGVMVYRTTPEDVPVFVSVCTIAVPQAELQSLNPVIVPPTGEVCIAAVQVNEVPPTVETKATFATDPLQTV